ncbi:hypothetical protein HCU66_21470 [Pseudomonas frederiksbergensis]|uniref:YecR family lipoprotein n=1 Tax=Pseudomonas frederiksbergensis TaxID=104087 RepID=UPI001981F5A3|nr:YecR family lipoprotein [Pseudomonas frederiksbergensis]MBN3864802.1 hypothetical protein [Pseudomonas frederiksbergensis]
MTFSASNPVARKLSVALALALSATLAGCATNKDFYAKGGSRADGVVDMAYDFQQFETPVVRVEQAQRIAKSKCVLWGYSDAEAFGGKTQHCNQMNGYGTCIAGQIVVQYQCLGNLNTSSASTTPAATAPVADAAATPAPGGPLSKDQWKLQQIQQLNKSAPSYEEYQKRYRVIMEQ